MPASLQRGQPVALTDIRSEKTPFNSFPVNPKAVGLRPLSCWDYGFESRHGHGCLSVVSVVCYQVEVPATVLSTIQRSLTECGVSECDHEASTFRMPWPTSTVQPPKHNCTDGPYLLFVYVKHNGMLYLQ
jgi:hypothetical protein